MTDEITLTLNSPITEEQWDAITDVDLEYTNEITFHTKHGKEVKFVKASAQPELDEWCTDCKEYDQKRHCCPRYNRVIREARDALSAQPERKRGRWIYSAGKGGSDATTALKFFPTCSACGTEHFTTNYCPNCGADMRGEHDAVD